MTTPERLRLAVVSTHPPGLGSLNEYGYHVVRSLLEKPEVGEVILLADTLPPGEEYESCGRLTVDSCWTFGSPGNAARVLGAVRRHRPDAVLFNLQFATFAGTKASGALGLLAPAMVSAAGYPTGVLLHNIMETVDLAEAGFASSRVVERAVRFFGNVTTRLLLRSDYVALTIPKYVELLSEKYGTDRVLLAPHGAFEEIPEPDWGLPPGPARIMAFGKWGTYKRVEVLLDAFEELQSEAGREVELVVAGTDSPNTPGYLAGVRERYAHVPNVRFTGYVAEEDVAQVFGEAAVVVFPYTSTTGSSGVLHQAGSYGKAVVLPRIGDFAELVAEEGYTGEYFDPTESATLAKAISRLLDDPQRRSDVGRQNWLAARGLPIGEVVDWHLFHLEDAIAARAPRRTRVSGRPRGH